MIDKKITQLGIDIDTASDNREYEKIEQLLKDCTSLISESSSKNRSILYFYKANCYHILQLIEQKSGDNISTWQQNKVVKQILHLRQSITEVGFGKLEKILKCKIITNLANTLKSLGRYIEANYYYSKALDLIDNFAMAVGNQSLNTQTYCSFLYNTNHCALFYFHINKSLSSFKSKEMLWDSGIQKEAFDIFMNLEKYTAHVLEKISFDKNIKLDDYPLGNSVEEQAYRSWCLSNKLFITPLNDILKENIAANDDLSLPNHIYRIDEEIRFPKYFNLIKQEFITARYMLYKFTISEHNHYTDNQVLLENGLDGVYLGYRNELLKSSFRIAYSIFDKIALFLNDYMNVGLKIKDVNFRSIWGNYNKNTKKTEIHTCFLNSNNQLLQGLYFLSKDLYLTKLSDVAEPEAKELNKIRNMSEHRYLGIQEYPAPTQDTDYLYYITVDDLEKKSLKMLHLAREGIIYLALAMHKEECQRQKNRDNELIVSIQSTSL